MALEGGLKENEKKVEPPREVIIHSDGACRGNPGIGGYGAILQCDGYEKEITGAETHTTNNRMELTGAIAALSELKERCSVQLVTDSEYLRKGITEWIQGWIAAGWKKRDKKPVLNRDLWERLHALCQRHDVKWRWVRGHAGDDLNERCDALANRAIDDLLRSKRGDP
jgi:ribonuclease HI